MLAVVRIGIPKLASHEYHGWVSWNFARQSLGTPYRKETRHCFFSKDCQISGVRLQLRANWTVPFCINAVARRTTGLILRFAFHDILSRCARTRSDDCTGNY